MGVLMTALGVSSLVAATMFLLLSAYARQLTGIRLWATASGLMGLAMVVDGVGLIGDWQVASLMLNLPVTVGQVLFLAGILQFCRRPIPTRALAAISTLFLLFTVIFTYPVPDAVLRIFSLTLLLGLVHAWSATVLWRHPDPAFRWVYVFTGLIILLHGLATSAQGIVLLLADREMVSHRAPEVPLANLISLWGGIVGTMLTCWLLFLLVMLRLVAELRDSADHDALTGLLNRRGLHQAMALLDQRPPEPDLRRAVLLMDIDRFKRINDRHGHDAGDDVLVLMGQVLRASALRGSLAARWGGEEFCVITDCATPEQAVAIAEAIRARFHSAASGLSRLPQGATVSIGVAVPDPHQPLALPALIAAADAALYRAKATGRNRVVIDEHPGAVGSSGRGPDGAAPTPPADVGRHRDVQQSSKSP